LVRTEERGLATAVIDGFNLSKARVCAVIDADGSHPVENLPDMITPILEDEADAAVGSRHAKGGAIDGWPWHRRLVSRVASLLASGLTTLSDPTSGYMALRRTLLDGVTLAPVGWKIVLEVIVKLGSIRLIEIPITFTDRKLGKSKMSLREQFNYLRHLYRLYIFKFLSNGRRKPSK
jgi:dolichol-phosphate mannosyltransferase